MILHPHKLLSGLLTFLVTTLSAAPLPLEKPGSAEAKAPSAIQAAAILPLPNPLIPVVLKVDDLTIKGRLPERWKRITDFAMERKIKFSIGILANSLEGDKSEYMVYIKDL